MSMLARNNVRIMGQGQQSVVFAHGYGCDQNVWRLMAPAFLDHYRVVLFDHVGSGGSDLAAYDRERYATLRGYAEDVLDLCDAVCADAPVYVGHSVGAMIGALAAAKRPGCFSRMVMVAPSPCHLNDGEYQGGFERSDIDELLLFLDRNRLGWARLMATTIMGNPERPELAADLADSFCRTDPAVARQFARVSFLSDHRAVLPAVATETLLLRCTLDAVAPETVGRYMEAKLPRAQLVQLAATGHCPHLSAPAETASAVLSWLAGRHSMQARS
jgi:sigma-B regulation protein RsbQ